MHIRIIFPKKLMYLNLNLVFCVNKCVVFAMIWLNCGDISSFLFYNYDLINTRL